MVEPEKNVSSSSAQRTSKNRSEASRQFGGQTSFGAGQGTSTLESARQWVQQNQLMATVGAFALGAFIGAMMRD